MFGTGSDRSTMRRLLRAAMAVIPSETDVLAPSDGLA